MSSVTYTAARKPCIRQPSHNAPSKGGIIIGKQGVVVTVARANCLCSWQEREFAFRLRFILPLLYSSTTMPCQILFIGDSHTRGRLGSNYVEKLQHMVKDSNLQMLAFGVDGEPTEKIAQRVAPIFKHHPQPAAVFVLAGTNDCIAQEHSVMQWFYTKAFKLSRPCSLDYALENLQEMLRQIRKDAPDAKVRIILGCASLQAGPFQGKQTADVYGSRAPAQQQLDCL